VRIHVLCLAFAWILASPSGAAAQSNSRAPVAERFTSRVTLLADGSLDIEETLVLQFGSRGFSSLDREISLARIDDVFDVHATMDGRAMEEGRDYGQVQMLRGRRAVRVTWHFPDTSQQTRTFTLAYRVMGAMRVTLGRASVAWPILPPGRRYRIEHATVEWRVPTSVTRLIPTAIDAPGWTSAALEDGWAASSEGVEPGATPRLIDEFDETTLAVAVPVWQTNLDRAQQMAPAFVVGAATLIVMGAGIVGMTLFRYHRPRVDRSVIEPAPLGSLPPGVGTALARGRVYVGASQMRATFVDLVRRGVIAIERDEGRSRAFRIVMPHPAGLAPHEQVVADALWTHLKRDQIELRAGWRSVQRALPAFRRAVMGELRDGGFLDRDRQFATRGLLIAGVAAIVFGVGGVALFARLFGDLGDLPLVVPGAVVVSGVLLVVSSQVMPILSQDGVRMALAWRARRDGLARSQRETAGETGAGDWLPAASGMGLTATMKKRGLSVPDWLSELSSHTK